MTPHLRCVLSLMIAGGWLIPADPARAESATTRPAPAASLATSSPTPFVAAVPVWPAGLGQEMNLQVGFRTTFDLPQRSTAQLRITAANLYRAYVNGQFVAHGPTRAPAGWARVDELDLTPYLREGLNQLAIEVVASNIDSYYLMRQHPYLWAELIANRDLVAATGDPDRPFQAFPIGERIQKLQRYSHQRTFIEGYRLTPGSDRWRERSRALRAGVELVSVPAPVPLPRGVPIPLFHLRPATIHTAGGRIEPREPQPTADELRAITQLGLKRGGFPIEQLEADPAADLLRLDFTHHIDIDEPIDDTDELPMSTGAFDLLDFGRVLTGFIGLRVTCDEPTRLLLTFDEALVDGTVDFKRNHAASVILYELAPGTYDLESFEPYTLRYLQPVVTQGTCTIQGAYLREYAAPQFAEAHFAAADPRLGRLFEAARETLRHNAVDLFMDCPSRERAVWLGDSFWTARSAFDLAGVADVERIFFENYRLPDRYAHHPEGMLPKCYPADHRPGGFLPNWAMWFVLQLEEYQQRTNDRAMTEAFRGKIHALAKYFEPYRNEQGLLENLDGWVFVDWSKANDYTSGVNIPTNILYAAMLDAAGRLYDQAEWADQARQLRERIRTLALIDGAFIDQLVREGGALQPTAHRSEACQYYAFLFGLADPQRDPQLWQALRDLHSEVIDFPTTLPALDPANLFIGRMMRLDLLSKFGQSERIHHELLTTFAPMAEASGTLWENLDGAGSRCHGFAAHVASVLYRDVLGIHRHDPIRREVVLRLPDLPLDWCEGRLPTPAGAIAVRWWRDRMQRYYRVQIPAGYRLTLDPAMPADWQRRP